MGKHEIVMRRLLAEEQDHLRRKRVDQISFWVCAVSLILSALFRNSPVGGLFLLISLLSWLVFIEFISIPRSVGQEFDLKWRLFMPHSILENAFHNDKGWKTIILMLGYIFIRFLR